MKIELPITRIDSLRAIITPAIIINYQTLGKTSIWQLTESAKSLSYYENIFKEIVNFSWGNSSQYFSNCNGMLFSFRLSQTNIIVWDTKSKQVFEANFPDEFKPKTFPEDCPNYDAIMPKAVFDAMIEAVDLYAAGKIKCSKCATLLFFNEVAGTFYAGSYCGDCWEGGVRQQELREKYD